MCFLLMYWQMSTVQPFFPGRSQSQTFSSATIRQPSAGCLLQVNEYLIIQDPLAGWPLPTSLALLAASASVIPCGDSSPTPAHCSQRHQALLSLCAFAQAVLSARATFPCIIHHLEICLWKAQIGSHHKLCPPVIGHHRLTITATNICEHKLLSRRP